VAVRLTCTDYRIIEILGLRSSNRLPVSYYFNSVGHVNLFLNIMNGVTKKQRLAKQNPLKIFYYNKIIEVKTLLSVKK
jgi:hypothetical protein